MKAVYAALVNLGLEKQVAVVSAHSLNILQTSYPPSSGSFKEEFIQYLKPLLDFHSQIKSPFLINAYPFFAYKDIPKEIPLEYVLFQPNQGMVDPNTNLHYDNMLFAQVHALYSAIKTRGHTDIEVRISETGWPYKGDENEIGASIENTALYNGNLLRLIQQRKGTPAKQSVPIDIYEVRRRISMMRQDGDSVDTYFGKMNKAWMELSEYSPEAKCACSGCRCDMNEGQRDSPESWFAGCWGLSVVAAIVSNLA